MTRFSRGNVILLFIASPSGPQMRGGRSGQRDRWFGLEEKDDFWDFRHWWHREGKDAAGGWDLKNRSEAEAAYQNWSLLGKPKVK
jgi:hypothetical protein